MEKQTGHKTLINNDFYDELEEAWYFAFDHPIALLRAENAARIPWVKAEIKKRFSQPISILDVGCGAGLLTNALAQEGHAVSGIDLSEKSLGLAEKHDPTQSVKYVKANAYELPFLDSSFDAVSAMDVLEHVENPAQLISEASRVLKKGGLFFFHTFNRNFLSYLFIIKGVEWFVKNAPKHMHVYPLFIKPKELEALLRKKDLQVKTLVGFRPTFNAPFFKMLMTRKIPKDFQFSFSKSLATGYCGIAQKIPLL